MTATHRQRQLVLPLAIALMLLPALPDLARAQGQAAAGASALRAEAERIAGAPVAIDPRLAVPACPTAHQFAASADGRSLAIACPATGWRTVAAIARAPAQSPGRSSAAVPPAVRRGDIVQVATQGPGFRITVEAIAEANAAPGERVMLKNRLTGQRFPATVSAQGQLAAAR